MTLDLAGLLAALDRDGIRFVVVGSAAALAHGLDAAPNDLDIVPDTSPENLRRLDALLRSLDAEAQPEIGEWRVDSAGERVWVRDGVVRRIEQRDPESPITFDHTYETRLGRLDIVPEVAGGYASLSERARTCALAGRRVQVAHPLDVLAGMTRPRRDKDGPRVRQLRELLLREMAGGGSTGSAVVGRESGSQKSTK